MSRQSRYVDFDTFAIDAKARFSALHDADERAKEFSKYYSFCPVKGGINGGNDSRFFEVFFGNRPIYSVQNLQTSGAGNLQITHNLITEKGVNLRYFRTDVGTVVCTLFPAKTKDFDQPEDSIVLDFIAEPKDLHSSRILKRHWRAFMSYMECTSVDGEPRALDKIRVEFLRFTCPLIIDGRVTKRKVVEFLNKFFGYVLTIGLSGFLLTLINMVKSSEETDKIKVEIATLSHRLSEANSVIQAQNKRIIDLEQHIDSIQTDKAAASKVSINRVFRDKAAHR